MVIMFKKTVVILFLFSQVLAAPASKTKSYKKHTQIKATGRSPILSCAVQSNSSPKSTTMRLHPRRSPLAINEVTSGSASSSSISVGAPVEEGKHLNDVKLVRFENEELDNFDFDFLGLTEEEIPTKPIIDSLIEAIHAGDLNSVLNLIPKGVDLNSFERGPRTPFMLALQAGNPEIIDTLLSTGKVDPNIIAANGCDVLSLAAGLLGLGVFVEKIIRGPIKVSAFSAFTILLNLKRNSNPNFYPMIATMAKSLDFRLAGALVLMAKNAVLANDIDLVRYIHLVGIPLNRNYRGVYFIHYAAIRGYTEMVSFLIECGTPIDILIHWTLTSPLQTAYFNKKYAVAIELIKKGASHGLVDCIFNAILENNISIIQALISKYSNLNDQFIFENGLNPVTLAISADKPEILQLILESENTNPMIKDPRGNNIYNMEISENASEGLKEIIQRERNFADEFIDLMNF